MSIFKSTLSPTVSSQLKARETIVSQNTRGQDFLMYTTGKNSFVRLRSFVDYTSYKINSASNTKLSEDGRYTGNNLSKKWVLEGGTLYNKPNSTEYSLRAGVGSENSVYASDLDFNNQDRTSDVKSGLGVDRLYGLRPMPGITSVEVMNKNAYGSLREATINFFCWDRHQLEELEILYMRPGYSCYLEWGWSQYLDHDIANVNQSPSNIKLKTFEGSPLDTWKTDLDDDKIYGIIDNAVDKYKGNYDAMLGYVKNYSWQLMPNGGFQCSTTLISRGEVIDTIKVSSNPNIIIGSTEDNVEIKTSSASDDKPIYNLFEKIFLNLVAHINDTEFWNAIKYQWINTPGQFYSTDDTTKRNKLISEADKVYNDINTRILNGSYKAFNGTWDDPKIINFDPTQFNLDINLAVKLIDGGTEEGMGIEYISMNAFIAILTEFFIPKNEKTNKPAINIIVPNITPCLASEDSVSVDPTTCVIKNSKASFVCDNTDGFNPQLFGQMSAGGSPSPITTITDIPEFIQSGTNIGTIGQIYISISKILQIYRNLSGGPDGVDVIKLLQEILDACSFALGGINDFKLYNDKSTVQIIDIKYFETKGKDSKFKFDLIGLKSICRDVKINSRIFSEQSTMIAIGATSGEQNANLGDIYSSTQNYFNLGLSDRILKTTYRNSKDASKITVNGVELEGERKYYWTIYHNVNVLAYYLSTNVLGKIHTVTTNTGALMDYNVTKIPQSNQVINAGSLLKTFHYQINGKDTNFKALIPFELEITLDGIGGFIVGQIFTIDKSILPRDYFNKNLGFVITGINHSLQNNDWVTTIKTQICLLENDKIKDMYGVDKNLLKETIQEIKAETEKSGYLLCALADLMVHITIDAMSGKYTPAPAVDFDDKGEYSYKHPGRQLYGINRLTIDFYPKMYSNGTDVEKPTSMIDFISAISELGPYTQSESKVEQYLKNWWTINSTKNLPNFPATYDDLLKTKILGVEKVFDLKGFCNLIYSQDSTSEADRFIVVDEVRKATTTTPPFTVTTPSKYNLAWESMFWYKVINQLPTSNKEIIIPSQNTGAWVSDDYNVINKFAPHNYINQIPYNTSSGIVENAFICQEGVRVNNPFDPSGLTKNNTFNIIDINGFTGMHLAYFNFLNNNRGTIGLDGFEAPPSFTLVNIENVN